MDDDQVARLRRSHQLVGRHAAAPVVDVVRTLGAVQAQDLLPARWSVALRTGGAARDVDVAAALDLGEVLRLHVLRPTWHLVAAADVRWLLRATAGRVQRSNGLVYARSGLDDETLAATRRVLAGTLGDGVHRSRAELAAALAAAGRPLAGEALAYALIDAELAGLVCSGRSRGGTQTYALLDERAPGEERRTREESLAELARRYVAGRGPVTAEDLAAWASLTLGEARRAVAGVADGLESWQRDGLTWWWAPDEAAAVAPVAPVDSAGSGDSGDSGDCVDCVDLVQAYDELVISYSRTRDVVTGGTPLFDDAARRLPHWVLVDGRAAGRWGYERGSGGRPARVRTRALRPWTEPERAAVGRAVATFGVFVGSTLAWDHAVA